MKRVMVRLILLSLGLASCLTAGAVNPFSQTPTASATYYSPYPATPYRLKDFAIIKRDGIWHVFAIHTCIILPGLTCDNTHRGLVHLTSPDLKNWKEVGFVLPPGGSGWRSSDIWAPSIVERNGVYYMFFTGVQGALNQHIGYATSTDLWNWTLGSQEPVWSCENLSWSFWDTTVTDGTGTDCRDPFVTWDAGQQRWVMTYSARKADAGTSSPWIKNPMVIGQAVSSDLVHWQDNGYLTNTIAWVDESSHIFEHNGLWYLVWTTNSKLPDNTAYTGLKYAVADNIYGPYTNIGLPAGISSNNDYASEFFNDDGHDRLADCSFAGIVFRDVVWSGQNLGVSGDISYGKVGGQAWIDTNDDQVLGTTEAGIKDVTVTVYNDDGDTYFEPNNGDYLYAQTKTGDDQATSQVEDGVYKFDYLLPGAYWVTIDKANFDNGHSLAGLTGNSHPLVRRVIVAANQTTELNYGFNRAGHPWTLSDETCERAGTWQFAADEALVLNSPNVPAWWNQNYRYRQLIQVAAGTQDAVSGETATVTADLAGLEAQALAQSEARDLRVVYFNGTNYTELNFNIDQNGTIIFPLAAAIGAGNTDDHYYLYFGYPGAPMPIRAVINPIGNNDSTTTIGSTESRYPARSGSIQPLSTAAAAFTVFNSLAADTYTVGSSFGWTLSNDGGTHWLYWSDGEWRESNGTIGETNSLTEINDQAGSFPVGGGRFLWRAVIDADEDDQASLFNVVTSFGQAPTTPSLIAPNIDAAVQTLKPQFQLQSQDADDDGIAYEIQIDRRSDFSSSAARTYGMGNLSGWSNLNGCQGTCYLNDSIAAYALSQSVGNGRLYWRARATDPYGSGRYSDYSIGQSFVTPAALSISNPGVTNLEPTSAVINWTSTNPGDSNIWLGWNDEETDISQIESVTSHKVTLNNLQPKTQYCLSIWMTDVYGQSASSDGGCFTTPPIPTVINNLRVSVTAYGATANWNTNDLASTVIEYGASTTYRYVVTDLNLSTSHRVVITNLSPGTTYHFRVKSTGETTAVTPDALFRTIVLPTPRQFLPRLIYLFDNEPLN